VQYNHIIIIFFRGRQSPIFCCQTQRNLSQFYHNTGRYRSR